MSDTEEGAAPETAADATTPEAAAAAAAPDEGGAPREGESAAVAEPPEAEGAQPDEADEPPEADDPLAGGMLLGTRRDNGSALRIPVGVLARHAAMLGSTGSGKTVMAKALIEEATLQGVPSLIIDPQGDLARLCLGVDEEQLAAKGGDAVRRAAYLDGAEVRVWTPLRSKGLPICIDPFQAPPEGLDAEEAITAWDMVAAGFTSLTDYDMEKPQGKQVRTYLYEVLVHATRLEVPIGDFKALARVVRQPHRRFTEQLHPDDGEGADDTPDWETLAEEYDLPIFEEMLPRGVRDELGRRLASYASGVNQLLFSNGVPIDIDTFIAPAADGKTPVNVVYLNTIQDEAQKHYFVQEIARALYDWMLARETSDGELNLLFFMDEVAPYLPPSPRNPPAKDLIKLIFKQARKYGVAAVLATQNVSDVDYKILAQANTTFIGRFTQPQDIEKVKHLLKEGGDDLHLIQQLPTLGPGQFQLVCPDVSREPVPLQSRWLYSDHGAPFNEDQVEQHTPDTLREWAAERSSGRQRRRSGTGAAAAALGRVDRRKLELEEEGFTGMAAAARGSVDDEGVFDVQLMGGLSVLRDGRDPLYVMQGFTNTGSALVLLWSMIALLLQWHDGELVWFWALAGFLITTIVGLVVGLDLFLNHDAELQQKINHFARHYQYGLAAWLWLLLLWHRDPWAWWDFSLGTRLGTALEITTVWVTLFIVLEAVHRIRLGRLEMSIAGDGILGKLRSGVKSLSAVLTEGEIHDMRASARQVMEGLRWGLDFCTLLLFAYVVLSSLMGDLGDALGGDGLPRLVHPALWLGSIYLLLFLAETTIRRRAVEA